MVRGRSYGQKIKTTDKVCHTNGFNSCDDHGYTHSHCCYQWVFKPRGYGSSFVLGKRGAFIVGGLGSALADLLLGYAHYAPITLVVKGLEGYIAGSLLGRDIGKRRPIIATSVAGVFMAIGYFIPELFIYGKGAIASLPGNIMQGLLGAVTSVVLYTALKRTNAFN